MDGLAGTVQGTLRGVRQRRSWAFLGVPYARVTPPEGRGRWRLGEPPSRWAGIREASAPGPVAPQPPPVPGFSLPEDPVVSDVECLSLNVWTPAVDDGRRPVMVWIHGGGFVTGSGASALYRADRLASRGDVVVVTFNYRLGALGFLSHPALANAEGDVWGNWGLHDQIAALGWVQANIVAFGGDPGNVTVFGESAGAMSICALLAAPGAVGLFHRAVVQSGPPATASVRWATEQAERVARLLGERRVDRRTLEATAPGELVEALACLAADSPRAGALPLPLLPVIDEGLLHEAPADALRHGRAAPVPLMIGTTRDEAALFTATEPGRERLGLDDVARRMAGIVGAEAASVLVDAYRLARAARGESVAPGDLWTALTTDLVFRMPSLTLATARHPSQPAPFVYLFAAECPFLGGVFGSCHGLEIPYVFGTVADAAVQTYTGGGPQVDALSQRMQQAWLSFARSGDPSCDAVGEWPHYDEETRPTMVFGPGATLQRDPRGHERRAWDDARVTARAGHHHR